MKIKEQSKTAKIKEEKNERIILWFICSSMLPLHIEYIMSLFNQMKVSFFIIDFERLQEPSANVTKSPKFELTNLQVEDPTPILAR